MSRIEKRKANRRGALKYPFRLKVRKDSLKLQNGSVLSNMILLSIGSVAQ